jgi:hypothetical protein
VLAAGPSGFTPAGLAPSSCAKLFTSSPATPWSNPYGARAYYDLQIHNGKSHHAAVRALAFKWIRILFRCWKDGKHHDEQVYLQSLQKRNSPLKGLLPSALGGTTSLDFRNFLRIPLDGLTQMTPRDLQRSLQSCPT